MKKYVLSIIGVLAMSLLCGCSMYKLDLTASEHDKIAEYAAYALLSNAEDYNNKLLEQEEVDRILAERELEEKIRQEMENLNNQTTRPTQQPTVNQGETTGKDSEKTTANQDTSKNGKSLDDILNIENVSVQYAGYELCKLYPNDTSELVVLKANDNKQFVVLSFVLQNMVDKQTECDILSRNIVGRLHLDSGKTYSAMVTFMNYDLSTWNTPLAPQSMNMAFLIFQVPDTLTEQELIGAELSFKENGVTQSTVLK